MLTCHRVPVSRKFLITPPPNCANGGGECRPLELPEAFLGAIQRFRGTPTRIPSAAHEAVRCRGTCVGREPRCGTIFSIRIASLRCGLSQHDGFSV